jgi:hypothetical protein
VLKNAFPPDRRDSTNLAKHFRDIVYVERMLWICEVESPLDNQINGTLSRNFHLGTESQPSSKQDGPFFG